MIIHLKYESTLIRFQKLILENYMSLISNVYGNYVIQVSLEVFINLTQKWKYQYTQPILQCFYGNLYEFSLDKFSSNVIEKCIEFGGQEFIFRFINEVNEKGRIVEVIKNSFGNFVVQKALKIADSGNLFKLVSLIKKNLEKVNEKRLIGKWKSILKPYELKYKFFENSNQIKICERGNFNGNEMSFNNFVEKQVM